MNVIQRLFRFPGGVHVQSQKKASTGRPITRAPIPKILVLPLQQHIGAPAQAVVVVGEKVFKGQLIAKATDYVSAPVHAPTSGTIAAIEDRPISHPSGLHAPCIVLASDGEDTWAPLHPHAHDFRSLDPSALRNFVRDSGIVGLGGAGFPSFIKLNPGHGRMLDTLILNGAECEPYITCDDMLMRERADQIVAGMAIVQHAVQAKECVVAIEDNKPEAFDAMAAALARSGLPNARVVKIPTRYPAGGEKQLVYVITGKEVPRNGLPLHVGVVCQNVGTAAAMQEAILLGRPLISRVVTVAGDVGEPRNWEVLLGTRLNELIELSGGPLSEIQRLILGGPMMGFAMHSAHVPVIKTTNCVLVDAGINDLLSKRAPVMPCIRCGACADACPVNLLPQQLYWYANNKEYEQTQKYNLFDCIECGCCDYVCPSQIPLVQYYRHAKAEIWNLEREKQKADLARDRHEARLQRLEREKMERELKHKKVAVVDAPIDAGVVAPVNQADGKQVAILAALERAKAKKAAQVEVVVTTPSAEE